VTSRITEILATADKACTLDSDCAFGPDVRCQANCPYGTGVISKAGAAAVAAAFKDLCEPFFAAGCIVPEVSCGPIPLLSPACVAGACVSVPGPSRAGDGGASPCDGVPDETTNRLSPVLDQADKSCVGDSDCTFSPTVRCGNPCGLPVISKAGAAAVASAIAAVERDLCVPYVAAGCRTPPTYFCPAIGSPACVTGICDNGPLSIVDGGVSPRP
jgi:hypothetical protein